MRDWLLITVVGVLIPVAVVRPWIGVLAWYWLGFMNPHRLTWDFAYALPFAMMIALATLVGATFARDRKPVPFVPETVLAFLLLGYFSLTTLVAWAPDHAWRQLEKVAKIILMTLVTTMFIHGKDRIRWLLLVVALSIGYYGFKGGIWSLLRGGAEQVLGPENSFIEGNTFVGLALNMVIPLLVALGLTEQRKWLRRLLYATAMLSVVASIFTYSRGAWLGLAVILPFIVFQFGWKLRTLLVVAVISAVVTAPLYMPDRFLTRVETIENYEGDCSANQRFMAWTVHWNVARAHPFTGGGFELEWVGDGRYRDYGSEEYARCYRVESSAAHNIVLQVLGQHGFVAGLLYVILLAIVPLKLWRIRRDATRVPGGEWITPYAYGLFAGFLGYLVSGMFLSSAYFDLPWLYIAITAILGRELAALRAQDAKPQRQPAVVGVREQGA
jgi:putative inorganic carbon (hco3(-)) transporter